MTNAEAWLGIALRPRKPEGSLGRTAQDGHLDSHTAPELCYKRNRSIRRNTLSKFQVLEITVTPIPTRAPLSWSMCRGGDPALQMYIS